MNHQVVPINLGGRQHNLRFGAMGAYLLQRETGESILEFAQKVDHNTLGFMDLHALLWAELESSRAVEHTPAIPWTIASVGALIDSTADGDLIEFWTQNHGAIVAAFQHSFRITMKNAEELARRAEVAKSLPPPKAAVSTGDSPSTGESASTMPPSSAVRRKRSGVSRGVSGSAQS
jgi:hypothetical protein